MTVDCFCNASLRVFVPLSSSLVQVDSVPKIAVGGPSLGVGTDTATVSVVWPRQCRFNRIERLVLD